MKHREGFVSNSSSSSFIIAIRKGYSWEQLIEDSGPMKDFAKELADWLAKECPKLQSLENFILQRAIDWEGEEYAIKAIENGEYDNLKNRVSKLVLNPVGWFFGYGDASYNEGWNQIELWVGNGGTLDSENFKLVRDG